MSVRLDWKTSRESGADYNLGALVLSAGMLRAMLCVPLDLYPQLMVGAQYRLSGFTVSMGWPPEWPNHNAPVPGRCNGHRVAAGLWSLAWWSK